MRLERIEESPRRLHFVEAQEPLLLSMDSFEEQETVFQRQCADADERIFQYQRTEHRSVPPSFRLEIGAHARLPSNIICESIRRAAGLRPSSAWRLNGKSAFPFLCRAACRTGDKKRNSLPARGAREEASTLRMCSCGMRDRCPSPPGHPCAFFSLRRAFRVLPDEDDVVYIGCRQQALLQRVLPALRNDSPSSRSDASLRSAHFKEVTLDHVAERARVFKVPGAAFDARRLRCPSLPHGE